MVRELPVGAAFQHVLRSTFNNIGFAFNLSWPWMLFILPFSLAGNAYAVRNTTATGEVDQTFFIVSFGISLLTMFAFSSIAVSWHRYILKDEVPKGWARLRADNTVWRYFGNTLLIFLMLIAGVLPAVVVASLLLLLGNFGLVLAVPVYVAAVLAAIAAFYRWSVKLPAIALERRDYLFKHAWADTTGNFWKLLGLAFLFAAVIIGLAVLLMGFAAVIGLAGSSMALFLLVAVQLLANWLATIMAVTLLTSLYGFFVEKRDF